METTRESKVMRDLEARRAVQAKAMEGKSVKEKVRLYNEAAERAEKELGLNLPRVEKTKHAA